MKTRMQPIGNIFNKFPRVVRDLATACNKQVRIDMEGKETELDKTIIEAIKDPLTHLVRNSVDHGIETPEARKAAGKPVEGRLWLRAYHEGGQVNIEISDDGAGIDPARIKAKAIERGLIGAEQAVRLSDREILNLIFLPGLSTAEKVTSVSGRGVGMDVVKTNIEKISGTVDIHSVVGEGTTIRIKIPLTLAIIPALVVTSGNDQYAIPQVNLLELVRLEGEQAKRGIEYIHNAPVYRLRGNLLPLVYLNQQLGRSLSLANGAGNTAAVDFDQARAKHMAWRTRLRSFLDGKESLTQAQAVSERDCDLGKWLYGGVLTDFSHISELHQLEKAHAELHALVRQIIKYKDEGKTQQAEATYMNMRTVSDKIFGLLNVIEKMHHASETINIVVLRADERQFGLVVDAINDTQEIVVKPLGKLLKGIAAFAGATIMGDGRVALILDVLGIAQRANVLAESRSRGVVDQAIRSAQAVSEKQSLLLLRGADNGRLAIPLSIVARLEEFPRSAIERSQNQSVVQYRGKILPLLSIADMLQSGSSPDAASGERLHVVVYSENGRSVGLVVDRIIDIIEDTVVVQRKTGRPGILGSAVIHDQVTDLLDVHGIIRAADPGFFERAAA
jgi:two-component system chemotaxis sensor kinase CheA